MVTTPVKRRPRRRRRSRAPIVVAGVVALTCAAVVAAALLAWPDARLAEDADALARVDQPPFTGHVERVVVRDASGRRLPARVENGKIEPSVLVPAGEALTVKATVRRPAWAGWLVGRTAQQTLTFHAPSAALRGRWLEVRPGAALTLAFDRPVRLVEVRTGDGHRTFRFAAARTGLRLGVPGAGLPTAGALTVRAAPRTWERLSAPVQVHWFPARAHVQALVAPAPGGTVAPGSPITITFSRPVDAAIGTALPTVSPAVAGRWRHVDSHTLAFVPSGLGFPLDAHVDVMLPRAVALAIPGAEHVTRRLHWEPRTGSILRLEQLLAEAGYLPVEWSPSGDPVARTPQAQLAAATSPPAGRFQWPYRDATPKELRGLWRTGQWNAIVRGAVMMFEHDHGLEVDAFVGPKVWHALLVDAIAGKRRSDGYSYVYVHRATPQSLTLWHEGKVIVRSPGNTGVPAAPTQLGTFPVFEHIPVGTMSGTNPDGTRYHDPGIRWISYFNHGDAIHAFPRASFGTPQSLGCVELPLAAAATVWPYTPIGTLVTIEN